MDYIRYYIIQAPPIEIPRSQIGLCTRQPVVQVDMYLDEPYPPEKRSSGDFFGRQLPPLPTKRVCPPEKYYSVDSSFTLSQSKPPPPPPEALKVTIIKATDVGWCKLSQSVCARIDDGPQHWLGKIVFLEFFDPLYINPDDLQTLYGISCLMLPDCFSSKTRYFSSSGLVNVR